MRIVSRFSPTSLCFLQDSLHGIQRFVYCNSDTRACIRIISVKVNRILVRFYVGPSKKRTCCTHHQLVRDQLLPLDGDQPVFLINVLVFPIRSMIFKRSTELMISKNLLCRQRECFLFQPWQPVTDSQFVDVQMPPILF